MAIVINVATISGERIFSTSRGSAKTDTQARQLVDLICAKFPQNEGYEVTVFILDTQATELNPFTLQPINT